MHKAATAELSMGASLVMPHASADLRHRAVNIVAPWLEEPGSAAFNARLGEGKNLLWRRAFLLRADVMDAREILFFQQQLCLPWRRCLYVAQSVCVAMQMSLDRDSPINIKICQLVNICAPVRVVYDLLLAVGPDG